MSRHRKSGRLGFRAKQKLVRGIVLTRDELMQQRRDRRLNRFSDILRRCRTRADALAAYRRFSEATRNPVILPKARDILKARLSRLPESLPTQKAPVIDRANASCADHVNQHQENTNQRGSRISGVDSPRHDVPDRSGGQPATGSLP